MNNQRQQIHDLLYSIVGEGSCAGACTDAEIYQEDGEWKLFLCGFMEPWSLGKNLAEVELKLWEYTNEVFGLGAP